jgi:glyoxylase-like metal-dependent hydrolase (beta-lactamase superfamily II)
MQKLPEFELHTVDGYIETIYLAVYRDRVLLLDCGCSSDVARIVSYLDGLGRPMESIALAVASHAHPDHLGGAHILQQKYRIKVAAPARINSWYPGTGGFIQHRIDTMLAQTVARSNGRKREAIGYPRSLALDFPLREGDPLPFFADWVIVETPGHTNHDIVLYHPATSLLYAADVMIKVGKQFVLPIPVVAAEEQHLSFDKLKALSVRYLALAHRGLQPVEAFSDIIDSLQNQLHPITTASLRVRTARALQSFSPALRAMKKAK